MNKKDLYMLIVSALFLIFVVLIFVNAVSIEHTEEAQLQAPVEEIEVPRTSITFILGEDGTTKNEFYQNAEAYFRNNPEGRTDEIVTFARSLNEVYQSLNDHFERSSRAYNKINLVVHSNPWAGISIPVESGGPRITKEVLDQSRASGHVIPLNTVAVDSESTFHIHACGLGNNRELIESLRKTMNAAHISSTEGYVNFTENQGLYNRSQMDVHYAFYPTAYRPADLHLARQLKARYPEVDKNWLEGIRASSYSYNIPIEWEITYPEYDLPEVKDELDKLEWLMNQDELLEIIENTGIPFDYFRWKLKKNHNSIKVYGKVTVLCILEEMKV